ncbi:unnamed protein product, partial [Amoebophrya sp. A120]
EGFVLALSQSGIYERRTNFYSTNCNYVDRLADADQIICRSSQQKRKHIIMANTTGLSVVPETYFPRKRRRRRKAGAPGAGVLSVTTLLASGALNTSCGSSSMMKQAHPPAGAAAIYLMQLVFSPRLLFALLFSSCGLFNVLGTGALFVKKRTNAWSSTSGAADNYTKTRRAGATALVDHDKSGHKVAATSTALGRSRKMQNKSQDDKKPCVCVNEGDDKFTQAAGDAPGQYWLNATGIQDTAYGKEYEGTFGGKGDYGEYCFAWEDEVVGGKAGTNQDCRGTDDDRPSWCVEKWCYVKEADSTTAAIDATEAPDCANLDDVVKATYGANPSMDLYYSFKYCTTTTTTTTIEAG